MNNFGVFILCHNNVNVLTVEALRNSGYNSDIKIVIDDKDEYINEYIEKYGNKNVLIFSKEKIAERTDLMDNFKNFNCSTLARNFIIEYAIKNNYDYFIMFDDDISEFKFIFDEENKFKKDKNK